MLAGEIDGPLRPPPARLDHAVRVRVVADQFPGHLQGRAAGVDAGTPLGQQGEQPVPLRVSLLGQPAKVHRQGLCAAHQRAEAGGAQGRVRVAGRGGPLHVGDQPGVRGQRGLQDAFVHVAGEARGAIAEPGRQPPDRAHQRAGDRRADLVQGLDRRVDHPRPGGQVLGPGRGPFGRRRVVAVVVGQLELGQVQDRVTAVQLEVGENDLTQVLARGQVRLVVAVGQRAHRRPAPRRAGPGRPGHQPATGPAACRRIRAVRSYSRISATLRSHTARSRGERSMGPTLPDP